MQILYLESHRPSQMLHYSFMASISGWPMMTQSEIASSSQYCAYKLVSFSLKVHHKPDSNIPGKTKVDRRPQLNGRKVHLFTKNVFQFNLLSVISALFCLPLKINDRNSRLRRLTMMSFCRSD